MATYTLCVLCVDGSEIIVVRTRTISVVFGKKELWRLELKPISVNRTKTRLQIAEAKPKSSQFKFHLVWLDVAPFTMFDPERTIFDQNV